MKRILLVVAVGLNLTFDTQAAEFWLNGRTLVVPDGFTVECVARPPLVHYPTFADFDQRGRLYVAEASGVEDWQHEQPLDQKEHWHRLLQLTDTDGDGHFEQSCVFASFPRPPHGSQWHQGSLYVASPPIIWKLTDADDDGVAEKQEKWVEQPDLTGCLNDFHGPILGPDGWLYWTKGGGAAQSYSYQGAEWSTTASHLYRKHPRGNDVEQVMVGGMDNPVEVAFSRGGERFVTSTFLHLPGAPRKDGILHALVGGVYPKVTSSVFEFPWTGPDMLSEMAGWTALAPAGLTRYRSDQFGPSYRDNLFTALFNGHSVRRSVLARQGSTFTSTEEDFLRCEDVQFHPTDVLEDADGSLLVVETGGWYRHCCPSSTFYRPDVNGALYRIRREGAHLMKDPRGLQLEWDQLRPTEAAERLEDPRVAVADRAQRQLSDFQQAAIPALQTVLTRSPSARARSRAIWAATQIRSPRGRDVVRLGLTDDNETVRQAALNSVSLSRDRAAATRLVEILSGDSAHNRRVAAEALGRIGDASAVPALLAAVPAAVDRSLDHSLIFALIQIGDVAQLQEALSRKNLGQRRAAMIALDQMPTGRLDPQQVITELDSPNHRLQEVAWWIASRHPQQYGGKLASVLGRRIHDPRLTDEQRDALGKRVAQVAKSAELAEWISKELTRQGVSAKSQILLLRAMSGAGGQTTSADWIDAVLDVLAARQDSATIAVEAIATLASFRSPSKAETDRGRRLNARLRALAARPDLPAESRLLALSAVDGPLEESGDELFDFLLARIGPDQPLSVRTAAAQVLEQSLLDEDRLTRLAARTKHLASPELKQILGLFVGASSDRVGHRLVASLMASSSASSLRAFRLRHVLAGFSPQVQQEAEPLFARLERAQAEGLARADRVTALVGQADSQRGLEVFQSTTAACASCHTTAYVGGNTGPHLRGIGQRRSHRDLIESLLFPSASIVQGYQAWTVLTDEGRTYNGVIQEETASEIVLNGGPGKTQRVDRSRIEEMVPSDTSLMPAGIDKTLTDQQLADLVAYLKTLD